MRHHRLDLNLLVALRALLAERNVTRAGESIFVTQSAMSGILARLREYFDDQLIVPIGRKMELTPLAESLVDPISDLLNRIDATLATRPGFEPATTHRHFTIVAADYVIRVLLLDVLREVQRCAPHLTIEFRQPSETTSLQLDAGEVDFVITPERYTAANQSSQVLFDDSYTIVVDRDHPQAGDTMSLAHYQALGHVIFQSSPRGRPYFETWFLREHGDTRRIEILANSFHLVPHLVVGTNRVATMHSRLAIELAKKLPVRLVRPDFATPTLLEVLQWHKYRDLDPGSAWLRDQIVEHARKLTPLTTLQDSIYAS
jgi:LysR family transcriptional regulator, nod-box dependent transcriptional activator